MNPVNLRFAYMGEKSDDVTNHTPRFGVNLNQDKDEALEDDTNTTEPSSQYGCQSNADSSQGDEHRNPSLEDQHAVSHEEEDSLDRIDECIEYTRACLNETPKRNPAFTTNIATLAKPLSLACKMLREASQAGLAQLAWSSDREEVYTVGRPPPVGSVSWGEHWWLGLTPAQIRAGPGSDEAQVRRAEADLRKNATRQQLATKYKNGRLNVALQKTVEGVRRQEEDLRMCDSEDDA